MQFNPLFIPSSNISTVQSKGNNPFENANYLFADLLKVDSGTEQPGTSFAEMLGGFGLPSSDMNENSELNNEINLHDVMPGKVKPEENDAVDVSFLLNILFGSIKPTNDFEISIDEPAGGSNEQTGIVIKPVDEQTLINLIKNLKEELQNKPGFNESFRLNDIPESINKQTAGSIKLTGLNIEEIMNALKEESEISLNLKESPVSKEMFKTKTSDFNFNQKFERTETKTLQIDKTPSQLNGAEKSASKRNHSIKPGISGSDSNNKITGKSINSLKNKIIEELKIEKLNDNSFTIKLKSVENYSNRIKSNPAQTPLIIDPSVKQLLQSNYKIESLRKKISKILKQPDGVKEENRVPEQKESKSTENQNNPSSNKPKENKAEIKNPTQQNTEFVKTNSGKAVSGKEKEVMFNKILGETDVNGNVIAQTQGSETQIKAPAPKLINQAEVIGLISKQVKKRENGSIEIKLNPPELGKMKVKVNYMRDKLVVKMEVENEAARQLISQSIEQLKDIINQSGAQLKEVYVSLAGGEQRQQKSSDTKKRNSSVRSDNIIESIEDESVPKMMGYNTYDYLI